jgi:hypothetical protein
MSTKKDKFDASSSYHYTDFEILLKISTEDAIMQACLKTIMSTCLSHGIEVEYKTGKATDEYIGFVQRHYVEFCENAIRCMFTCGFVPWRLRKIENGALVPEVIPLGTFAWSVESNRSSGGERVGNKRKYSTEALSYRIRFLHSIGVDEKDVHIYNYRQPMGMRPSDLQSPLSGIVENYRHYFKCLARSEYADEWNTQAKMVCAYTSTNSMYTMNEGNPITNDWSVPQNRDGMFSEKNIPTEMEQNIYVRDAITERVVDSKDVVHNPTVYSLPKNSRLESMTMLQSNVDLLALQHQTAR